MRKKLAKRVISTMLMASMGLCLTACYAEDKDDNKNSVTKSNNLTQNVEAVEVETKELDDAFVYATADFSVNIFRESTMADIGAGENVLISPQSIITAMSMTTNGARENTLTQLQDTMYGGMEVSEYNKYMKDYSGRLTSDKYVDFHLANSVWLKDDPSLQVKEDFLEICKSYYDAGVYKEAFDDETTGKINGWVKENTNDMIDGIIDEIPEDVVMYLINATAFEGEWLKPYEEYQIDENGEFTNASGEKEKATMLNSSEEWYLQDDMARGFMKYYKGGGYAFVAMLPDEGVTMEEYVASLTGNKLIETYDNREYLGENVVVSMPEFSYEYDRELSNDFRSLGVSDAFDGKNADFSGIGQSSDGNLVISRILHKTYIELDRKGTKAAAVTAVEVATEACLETDRVETVILDRPFYYAIIDGKTGLPVFMGVVNSVN